MPRDIDSVEPRGVNPDLLPARQLLYQLSYGPELLLRCCDLQYSGRVSSADGAFGGAWL